jgi:hypothetical protein
MWYLYTMEFYSATRKNEILLLTSKWMGSEGQKSHVLPRILIIDIKQMR